MLLKIFNSFKFKNFLRLEKINIVLIFFFKYKLKFCGEVVLNISYKDRVEDVKFFIVDFEVELVFSGNICVKFGLLKRVYYLVNLKLLERRVELDDYLELFKGLGCLFGMYYI